MDAKDFPVDGTHASGDGSPSREAGSGPTERGMNNQGTGQAPGPARGPRSDGESQSEGTKSVSARKLEANRKNAQRSTGPKTEQGKANSASNSLVHGFFARKLFNKGQETEERQQYEELGARLKNYYQPIGFVEQLLVEEIFVELVRQGRLLRYEQQVLYNSLAFEAASDKVLRYLSAQNRHLARLMKELERLQEKRRASGRPEPSGPDWDSPLAESVDTTAELVATAEHASREASEDGQTRAVRPKR
jgi:hypothetical protein